MTNPEGGFFYLAQWSWLITLGWIIAVSQGVAVLGQLDPSGRLLTKNLGHLRKRSCAHQPVAGPALSA
jgi:hypothetical protein